MLVVVSKLSCGYRAGSKPLLSKGRNEIDEAALTRSQRRFIDALVRAKIAKLEDDDGIPPVLDPALSSMPPSINIAPPDVATAAHEEAVATSAETASRPRTSARANRPR